MIFNVPGHIDMIRNGLYRLPAHNLNSPIELRIVKTQTRRVNRGIYQVGRDYAVQRKRGVKAEKDIRIVMDRIWEEKPNPAWCPYITIKNAWAEGGYTPTKFEWLFRELNFKWDGRSRWAFEFYVIEVQK